MSVSQIIPACINGLSVRHQSEVHCLWCALLTRYDTLVLSPVEASV